MGIVHRSETREGKEVGSTERSRRSVVGGSGTLVSGRSGVGRSLPSPLGRGRDSGVSSSGTGRGRCPYKTPDLVGTRPRPGVCVPFFCSKGRTLLVPSPCVCALGSWGVCPQNYLYGPPGLPPPKRLAHCNSLRCSHPLKRQPLSLEVTYVLLPPRVWVPRRLPLCRLVRPPVGPHTGLSTHPGRVDPGLTGVCLR